MSTTHKLVPVEPTEEMLIAAWKCTGESQAMQSRVFDRMRNYFAAMLSASPEAPKSTGDPLLTACRSIDADYMTSEKHHPGYVLIPTATFNAIRSAASKSTTDDDETYEVGKRDGYESAVQDIDLLTGGDGEYRYCLGMEDSDRHTPDAETMKRKIAERFEALASVPLGEGVSEDAGYENTSAVERGSPNGEAINRELLDACRVAIGYMTGGMDGDWDATRDPVSVLRSAIAKASGGQS